MRDEWTGWCAHARRTHLLRVVANSPFLLLPSIAVANLGSHVLALAARRVVADWPARYGYAPVLLETFVDETRYAGTVYRAANWQRLEQTARRRTPDQGRLPLLPQPPSEPSDPAAPPLRGHVGRITEQALELVAQDTTNL